MKITYDSEVDAVYIFLTTEIIEPVTRQADEDINLDFDGANRLVGIEVLDASERLDLEYLAPLVENIGRIEPGWPKLRRELIRRKHAGESVKTTVRRIQNWVKEVGDDYVILLSEKSRQGNTRTITRDEIYDMDLEKHIGKRRIIIALRGLEANL